MSLQEVLEGQASYLLPKTSTPTTTVTSPSTTSSSGSSGSSFAINRGLSPPPTTVISPVSPNLPPIPEEILTSSGLIDTSKIPSADSFDASQIDLSKVSPIIPTDTSTNIITDRVALPTNISTKPTYIQTTPLKPTVKKEEIPVSPYLTKFGYSPGSIGRTEYDFDYGTILSDIESKRAKLSSYQKIIPSNLFTGLKNITKLGGYYATVQASKPESMWTIEGKDYSREEALSLLKGKASTNWDVVKKSNIGDAIGYSQTGKALGELEKTVKEYQRKGYNVDITPSGEYEFNLPKASDVHSWWVRKDLKTNELGLVYSPLLGGTYMSPTDIEATLLTSASFMESPLALGTLASGIASVITGDEGYTERRHERLAEYSLGMQEVLKNKDYGAYFGKVVSSPAMVEGVYLPFLTMGAGYAVEGISAGARTGGSILGKSIIDRSLIKFGSKIGSKGVLGVKGGMTGLGIVMIGGGALGAVESFGRGDITWYDVPSMATEIGFSVGMAGGGFKYGKSIWGGKYKIGISPPVTGDTKAFQIRTITESGGEQKIDLWGGGRQMIGKQPAQMKFAGYGETYGDSALGKIKGLFRTSKTGRLGSESWLRKFNVDYSSALEKNLGDISQHKYFTEMNVYQGAGSPYELGWSEIINTPAGKQVIWHPSGGVEVMPKTGLLSWFKSPYSSKLTVPSISEMVTGKGNIVMETISKSEIPFTDKTLTKYFSTSTGDIMGNFMKGGQLQLTDVYDIAPRSVSGGGGLSGLNEAGRFIFSSGKGHIGSVLDINVQSGGNLGFMSASVSDVLGMVASKAVPQPPTGIDFNLGGAGIGAGIGTDISTPSSGGKGAGEGGSAKNVSVGGGAEPKSISAVKLDIKPVEVTKVSTGGRGLSISKTKGLGLGANIGGGLGSVLKPRIESDIARKTIQQPVIGFDVESKKDYGLNLTPRVNKIFDLGREKKSLLSLGAVGEGVITESEKKFDVIGEVKPVVEPVFDVVQETETEYEPVFGTVSMQGLATEQVQRQKSGLLAVTEMATVPPVVITPVEIPPIIIPPPVFGGFGKGQSLGRKKSFWDFGWGKKGKRVLVKTVLADPFMVMHSQVKFGKATHMTPTESLWELGEKTWWRLPTLEMFKSGKKNNNSQISLNVLRR